MSGRDAPFARTISADDWFRVLQELGVPTLTAAQWSQPFWSEVQPARFSQGMQDLQALLPQVLHESNMLRATRENLNYTAARIAQVWPSRFPSEAAARPYADRPEELAERVYGGRMGNTMPGDGARFIGRGLIMATGRAAYRLLGDLMGQDLEANPQLLEQPHYAAESAVRWWEGQVPDLCLSDQVKIRRRVNGGTIGLAHCQQLADLCARVLA